MTTSDVALLLRVEHESFSKLLDVLGHHLGGLDRGGLDQGGRPDYAMVEAILDYFQGYADACHHPKEDLVYRKLQSRQRGGTTGLSDLVRDHEELASLTSRVADLVRTAQAENRALDEPLEDGLRDFVESYRRHMAMEEKYFLSAAESNLTRGDWDEIEFDLFDKKDPLLDEEAEHRFQDLRKRILAMDRRG